MELSKQSRSFREPGERCEPGMMLLLNIPPELSTESELIAGE